MRHNVETIPPDMTVAEMVMDIFRRQQGRAVPVCRNDRLEGIVTISDVKKIPQEQWAVTPVERIMTRVPALHCFPGG